MVKTQTILKILEDLDSISPENFENVGHTLICCLENKQFRHPGVNKKNIAVKGSVDTVSCDGTVVSEYSINNTYFSSFDDFNDEELGVIYTTDKEDFNIPTEVAKKSSTEENRKLHTDLIHAIETQKKVKKIYLLSSQEKPQKFEENLNKRKWYEELSKDYEIIILGNKDIAEKVEDLSKKNLIARENFAYYLTSFSNYIDSYECFGRLPTQKIEYKRENKIFQALENHFKNHNICVLYGTSGAGKTQSIIDFVTNYFSDKDKIWINASDYENCQSFSSIRASRNGQRYNIAGTFNLGNSVLIIDNVRKNINENDFSELQIGLNNGGKIICTSQLFEQDDIYLRIPQFQISLVKELLEEDSNFECKPENKRIYDICRSCPMAITFIRETYKSFYSDNDRNTFYKFILDSSDKIEDDRAVSILEKLIEKLPKSVLETLKLVCSINVDGYNPKILRKFITLDYAILLRLSFLDNITSFNTIIIHDLLKNALCGTIDNADNVFLKYLNNCIDELQGKMTTEILHQGYLCRQLINKFLQSDYNSQLSWIYYLAQQINGEEKKTAANYFIQKSLINSKSFSEVHNIIDAKENYILKLRREEKEKELNKFVSEIETTLNSNLNMSQEQKTLLLHHLGKSYRRLHNFEKSLECFREVLKITPDIYETWSQIINLGSMYKCPEEIQSVGKEYYKKMLEQIENDNPEIPTRIKLAFISFANNKCYKENAIQNDVDIFSNIIKKSYLIGFDQIYEAFVSFVRLFSSCESEKTLSLYETISTLSLIDMNDFKLLGIPVSSYLDALSGIYSIMGTNKSQLKEMLVRCISSYNITDLKDFDKRAVLKVYVEIGNSEETILIFENYCKKDKYENENDYYLLYWYIKALFEKNENTKANNYLSIALDLGKRLKGIDVSFLIKMKEEYKLN